MLSEMSANTCLIGKMSPSLEVPLSQDSAEPVLDVVERPLPVALDPTFYDSGIGRQSGYTEPLYFPLHLTELFFFEFLFHN